MSKKAMIIRERLRREGKRIVIKRKKPDPIISETTRVTTIKRTGRIGLTALIQVFNSLNP